MEHWKRRVVYYLATHRRQESYTSANDPAGLRQKEAKEEKSYIYLIILYTIHFFRIYVDNKGMTDFRNTQNVKDRFEHEYKK